jgi:COMPASS component SWD3
MTIISSSTCTELFHITDGDWAEVEKLSSKPIVKNHRSFLYSLYKQQYLEYIEHREIQKV